MHTTIIIDAVSSFVLALIHRFVFGCVTFTTHQLEVLVVQGYLRVLDVHGCQLLDVMHDDTRLVDTTLDTVLAEVANTLSVSISALLPRLRMIEALSE